MIVSKCKEHKQIVLTEEEIKKIPNDMELGAYIRKKFLNKTI